MNVTTLRPYYPTCSCFEKTKDLLLSMVKSRPICGQLWWESSEAESFLVLKTIWALTRSLTLISLVKSRSICSAVVSFLVLKTIHVAQCWQGAISFADNLLNLCLKWRKAPTLKSHTELNTQQLSIIYSNQCESHTVSQIRTLRMESSFNNSNSLPSTTDKENYRKLSCAMNNKSPSEPLFIMFIMFREYVGFASLSILDDLKWISARHSK